jgi:anti-sigma regulatory factor (Ser/Thr protein kinase)
MTDVAERHLDYLNRLTIAMGRAYISRTNYETTVKSQQDETSVITSGRAYIADTLEVCRLCLLPHWRDFKEFVSLIPQDPGVLHLESSFNEMKSWIGAIDRRIVNFTRYRDEEVPMKAIPVGRQIRKYVDEQLRYYVRSVGNKRLEIRLGQFQPGLIYADIPRFNRLLFNLVMNACDAMRQKKTGIILIEVYSTDLVVKVEITDEGVGMTSKKREEILTRDSILSGELHSLGFVFVRQTVKAFTGKLYVESELDRGTKISLVFPRYYTEDDQLLLQWDKKEPLNKDVKSDKTATETKHIRRVERAGELILSDFSTSTAPHPGSLFSISVTEDGILDHFVHKAYDPEWMMGHDDLAPMLYEGVFRGRYEKDDLYGEALILKSPHKLKEYWELRETPKAQQKRKTGLKMIHNEYILIARHLIQTGMSGTTKVYLTNLEQCFTALGQQFSEDPFPLSELAGQSLVKLL